MSNSRLCGYKGIKRTFMITEISADNKSTKSSQLTGWHKGMFGIFVGNITDQLLYFQPYCISVLHYNLLTAAITVFLLVCPVAPIRRGGEFPPLWSLSARVFKYFPLEVSLFFFASFLVHFRSCFCFQTVKPTETVIMMKGYINKLGLIFFLRHSSVYS